MNIPQSVYWVTNWWIFEFSPVLLIMHKCAMYINREVLLQILVYTFINLGVWSLLYSIFNFIRNCVLRVVYTRRIRQNSSHVPPLSTINNFPFFKTQGKIWVPMNRHMLKTYLFGINNFFTSLTILVPLMAMYTCLICQEVIYS